MFDTDGRRYYIKPASDDIFTDSNIMAIHKDLAPLLKDDNFTPQHFAKLAKTLKNII